MPERTVILAAQDATLAGIGEMRVEARKAGHEQVEIRLCVPLAWALRDPGMLAWVRDVTWGEEPKAELAKPWPGLTEAQARDLARELCLMLTRTDIGEATKRLVAHLRYLGCPQDQLAAWCAHIRDMRLGAIMQEEADA
jgi:hypothetical protein